MLMTPQVLQGTVTRFLGAVESAVPASFDQLNFEVSPVLGFAASTRFEVKVSKTNFDRRFLIPGDLSPDFRQWFTSGEWIEQGTHLDIHRAVSERHVEGRLPRLR